MTAFILEGTIPALGMFLFLGLLLLIGVAVLVADIRRTRKYNRAILPDIVEAKAMPDLEIDAESEDVFAAVEDNNTYSKELMNMKNQISKATRRSRRQERQ